MTLVPATALAYERFLADPLLAAHWILAGNPFALARRRRAPRSRGITRYLSNDWWATV